MNLKKKLNILKLLNLFEQTNIIAISSQSDNINM